MTRSGQPLQAATPFVVPSHANPPRPSSVNGDTDARAPAAHRRRRIDLPDVVARALIVGLFLGLAFRIGQDALTTGRPTGLLLLASELLVVVLTLVRRKTDTVDRRWRTRLIAGISIVGPFLLPAERRDGAIAGDDDRNGIRRRPRDCGGRQDIARDEALACCPPTVALCRPGSTAWFATRSISAICSPTAPSSSPIQVGGTWRRWRSGMSRLSSDPPTRRTRCGRTQPMRGIQPGCDGGSCPVCSDPPARDATFRIADSVKPVPLSRGFTPGSSWHRAHRDADGAPWPPGITRRRKADVRGLRCAGDAAPGGTAEGRTPRPRVRQRHPTPSADYAGTPAPRQCHRHVR